MKIVAIVGTTHLQFIKAAAQVAERLGIETYGDSIEVETL